MPNSSERANRTRLATGQTVQVIGLSAMVLIGAALVTFLERTVWLGAVLALVGGLGLFVGVRRFRRL